MAFKIDVIRPDDLLNLHIEGVNLQVKPEGRAGAIAAVENPQQPAYLVVQFPPQTIAERAFFEASPIKKPVGADPAMQVRIDRDALAAPNALAEPGKVSVRLGGPSRLVFRVPDGVPIPFTLAGLLDWSALELVVSPLAGVAPTPVKVIIRTSAVNWIS
ncbi:hypothetical protein IQ273_30965 [Nodosilinea sp. LEGE 07298]|uniref:hypothetical protein n=1 Tax=Nodosilinea sp. LEGE 07298 TaxID=2777970 RepID=UPI0018808AB6|nr:hypothetical protein [Nodosilinea sp. LEGE 07298]MBE9113795.1 hypothetical protein [Nodosilinea sp. LEGE 07298]